MTMPRKIKTILAENGLFYATGLILSYGLKSFYSHAGAGDLSWILLPTSRVVEYLSGIHFERDVDLGLVNHACRFIIVPSCAGVNFLTIAFCALFFSFVHRLNGMGLKSLWLGVSAASAYLLTLGANALRIIAAVYLWRADIYGGWMTVERVHRIEGAFIYFLFLLSAYLAAERVFQGFFFKAPGEWRSSVPEDRELIQIVRRCLVPFFWYSLIGLGIPLAGMANKTYGAMFIEHASVVTLVCLCILLLVFLVLCGYRKTVCTIRRLKRI